MTRKILFILPFFLSLSLCGEQFSLVGGDWTNENLTQVVTAQAKARLSYLNQTRTTGLQDAYAGADAQPQFSQSANPPRVAANIRDVGPLTDS